MNSYDFFNQELQKANLSLEPAEVEKLLHFTDLLLEANQTVNLTAITNLEEVLIKHLLDSLLIINFPEYVTAGSILDLGSGAGIPGLPLAITSPSKLFVSIDATLKKIKFQEQASQVLKLQNYTFQWGRAEELAHQPEFRARFNLVTARAVAAINVLAELTLPFIQIGGYVILYKSKDYQSELQTAENAINTLGGRISRVEQAELPSQYGCRSFIILKKVNPTPSKYPRQPSALQKRPL